jgi:RHS repeat-associated protein
VNASFVYDGVGRREAKTINGSLTEFLYDGVNPVRETSGSTILANTLTALGVDEFLTRTDTIAGTTSHLLRDALGSVVALVDNTAQILTENTYEPFGKMTTLGSLNTNPFHYTGREHEGASLYYYRARYYDASLHRFLREDPILQSGDPAVPFLVPVLLQNPQALNAYSYALNSPIRMRDPLGLSAEDECIQQAWNDMWYRCIIPIVMAADAAFVAVVLGCSTLGAAAPACILSYGALVELPVLVGVGLCYSEYVKKVELCRCRR